ncbi:hypothetical protein EW026_g7013 [Hermanssonia centrifuga]|uniref:Uncharacterized protein n=1 Tax=Hermanssonia centrifuga TaxID=98765 RepID=A0A4S4KDK4_9APHY|nr:hypothetical protein EW026_g7013 [Hermanssonia centrifuga]
MRGFSTMFHSSPSAKSSVPQSHGVKLLGQHLFQNIVARGDQYKCSAWDALFAAKSEVGEDTFLDLQVVHDALSIDREELAEVIDHTVPLSLEWVSRAKSYKSQAKDFLTAVQNPPAG